MQFAPSLIASHSGLRGRPDVDLTEEVVRSVVCGFTELLRQRGLPVSLGVARDERPDGRALAAEASRAALASGADVLEFGVVSTPTAKLAARLRGLGGCVVITGSHLEPDWNGLKLVAAPHYGPLDVRDLPAPREGRGRSAGRLEVETQAASEHASAICTAIDATAIRAAQLHVGCTGGAGSIARLLLSSLGCSSDPPLDLTLRLDPDGDRLQLVDERGRALDPEVTLPLAALAVEARRVVKGRDTSRMVDEVVTGRGGVVFTVTPGELHLVEALLEQTGDLAGEGNGGVVWPAVGLARDGLAAAAAILQLRARSREPLSELAARLPHFVRRRSTVPCSGPEPARLALECLASSLGGRLSDVDAGVLVQPSETTWGLARRSATEHVLRVTVEARSASVADELHADLRAALSP